MNCARITDMIRTAPMAGWDCREDAGFLRLTTPLRYPDGGSIELYVEERGGSLLVTDYGEAFRFLSTFGIDPLRSSTRERMITLATALGDAILESGPAR